MESLEKYFTVYFLSGKRKVFKSVNKEKATVIANTFFTRYGDVVYIEDNITNNYIFNKNTNKWDKYLFLTTTLEDFNKKIVFPSQLVDLLIQHKSITVSVDENTSVCIEHKYKNYHPNGRIRLIEINKFSVGNPTRVCFYNVNQTKHATEAFMMFLKDINHVDKNAKRIIDICEETSVDDLLSIELFK